MSKRNIMTYALVALGIIAFLSVWFVGYTYLSNRIDNNTRRGFIEQAEGYLKSDEEFKNQYGELVSLKSEDKMPIKNDASDAKEYYMDFTCITDKGTFSIRVYHTWKDTWIFSFEDLGSE